MHLAQQSNDIVAKPPADFPSVPCQGMLPGIMRLILSPLKKAHKPSQVYNGLQAVSMTKE